jgi:hypothetical protein
MTIHDRENNEESEEHLKENHKKFSQQCLKVLELLRQGKRLTTMNAPSHGILSLPRRIKDLRDYHGVHIDEQWLLDNDGKQTIKEWFINKKTDRPTKKELTDWGKRYIEHLGGPLKQTELFNNNEI